MSLTPRAYSRHVATCSCLECSACRGNEGGGKTGVKELDNKPSLEMLVGRVWTSGRVSHACLNESHKLNAGEWKRKQRRKRRKKASCQTENKSEIRCCCRHRFFLSFSVFSVLVFWTRYGTALSLVLMSVHWWCVFTYYRPTYLPTYYRAMNRVVKHSWIKVLSVSLSGTSEHIPWPLAVMHCLVY